MMSDSTNRMLWGAATSAFCACVMVVGGWDARPSPAHDLTWTEGHLNRIETICSAKGGEVSLALDVVIRDGRVQKIYVDTAQLWELWARPRTWCTRRGRQGAPRRCA